MTDDEIWNAAIDAAIAMANHLGGDRPRGPVRDGNDKWARDEQTMRAQHVRARTIATGIGLLKRPLPHQLDNRPDGSGLDDGPYLPGKAPRKRAAPKGRAEVAQIRARAWATRRLRYGQPGHRRGAYHR